MSEIIQSTNNQPKVYRESGEIKKIKRKVFDSLGNLFWNSLPHESVAMLIDFNWQVLTDEFKSSIFKILKNKDLLDLYEQERLEALENMRLIDWVNVWTILWKSWHKKLNDKHHIIPDSKWWATNELNIRLTRFNIHRDFHIVFGNLLPIEQIRKLLELYPQIFLDEFEQELGVLLEWSNQEFYYKKGVMKDF